MKTLAATLVAVSMMLGMAANAADGLIAVRSPHSPADTASRLDAALKQRKLTVFARVDHAAGATSVGATLRPTEVFIFGNPQGGTPFMTCQQSVGIDLPLKALVWQDASGQTWIGYNDPAWIGARHGAKDCPVIANLTKALSGLAAAVVSP
jgi:uncharacterized protein (DUF302 family)